MDNMQWLREAKEELKKYNTLISPVGQDIANRLFGQKPKNKEEWMQLYGDVLEFFADTASPKEDIQKIFGHGETFNWVLTEEEMEEVVQKRLTSKGIALRIM